MKTKYIPSGVCATGIELDIEDGLIKSVQFTNGCDGSLKGITALVSGTDAREAAAKLKGITCSMRPTSCPEQLALAILENLKQTDNTPNFKT